MQKMFGRSVFLALSLSFAGIVAADAIVDPQLAQRLAAGERARLRASGYRP